MPIPKPKGSEDKEKFISRCMSELATEFEDNAQRYAVCQSSWEEKFSSQNFLRQRHIAELDRFKSNINTLNFLKK